MSYCQNKLSITPFQQLVTIFSIAKKGLLNVIATKSTLFYSCSISSTIKSIGLHNLSAHTNTSSTISLINFKKSGVTFSSHTNAFWNFFWSLLIILVLMQSIIYTMGLPLSFNVMIKRLSHIGCNVIIFLSHQQKHDDSIMLMESSLTNHDHLYLFFFIFSITKLNFTFCVSFSCYPKLIP